MSRISTSIANVADAGELPAAAPSTEPGTRMNMAIPVSAACRAAVPHRPDEPIAPPTRVDRLPTLTGRGAAGRLLIVGTVAMALGLGAVMASLAPLPGDRGDVSRPRPPAIPRRLAGESAPDAVPWVNTTSPESSPLHPWTGATMTAIPLRHDGVTFWDPVEDSSNRDRRGFLMSIATQVHAPASAPAPRLRSAPPHPHGVD